MTPGLADSIAGHLGALCAHPHRHPGGRGNRAANEYFEGAARRCGLVVERLPFGCVHWEPGRARLEAGPVRFDLAPGPYSPPCDASAALVPASTAEEIGRPEVRGSVLLLHGGVAARQLTPRGYPFYTTPEDEALLSRIEAARPAAVVAATGIDPPLTGAAYPFPLIEDGSFAIPSATMKDVDGRKLAASAGQTVRIVIDSKRQLASAVQLIGRKTGSAAGRFVLCAHIDGKVGTPGALDNAAGVACLLAAAELLRNVRLRHALEVVPFNGEDHYAAPGEVAYLAANPDGLSDVVLAVNLDAAGLRGGTTAVSQYGCPDRIAAAVTRGLSGRRRLAAGDPWPQSDHMVFAMRGVPAVALTSDRFAWLQAEIAHTSRDTPDLVDPALLAVAAEYIRDLVVELDADA